MPLPLFTVVLAKPAATWATAQVIGVGAGGAAVGAGTAYYRYQENIKAFVSSALRNLSAIFGGSTEQELPQATLHQVHLEQVKALRTARQAIQANAAEIAAAMEPQIIQEELSTLAETAQDMVSVTMEATQELHKLREWIDQQQFRIEELSLEREDLVKKLQEEKQEYEATYQKQRLFGASLLQVIAERESKIKQLLETIENLSKQVAEYQGMIEVLLVEQANTDSSDQPGRVAFSYHLGS